MVTRKDPFLCCMIPWFSSINSTDLNLPQVTIYQQWIIHMLTFSLQFLQVMSASKIVPYLILHTRDDLIKVYRNNQIQETVEDQHEERDVQGEWAGWQIRELSTFTKGFKKNNLAKQDH